MHFSETTIDLGQIFNKDIQTIQLTRWRENDHLACVLSSGQLVICDLNGNVRFEANLDRFFDVDSDVAVHRYGTFLAIVNPFGLRGVVVDLNDGDWRMPLCREDYYCEHCEWPIGFYSHDCDTMLIHSTQWNRLDITNLATGQLLTKREVCYGDSENPSKNYLDYFHSMLHMSPNERSFVINGWHWGPFDQLFAWETDRFLVQYENSGQPLGKLPVNGYNWNRPCCFYDDATIAWGYNALEAYDKTDSDTEKPTDSQTELIFQNIHSAEITRRIPFEHFGLTDQMEVKGRLWFDSERKWFVCSSNRRPSEEVKPKLGTTVASEDGTLIQRWSQTAQFVSTSSETSAAVIGFLDETTAKLITLTANEDSK